MPRYLPTVSSPYRLSKMASLDLKSIITVWKNTTEKSCAPLLKNTREDRWARIPSQYRWGKPWNLSRISTNPTSFRGAFSSELRGEESPRIWPTHISNWRRSEMKTRTFSFELPEELIAQHPAERRGTSRLMVLNRRDGSIAHHSVADLPSLLPEGSLLVLNDSRVRKARLYGTTSHSGKVQVLLISHNPDGSWRCMVSKAKKQKPGREYLFPGDVTGKILSADGELRTVEFSPPIDDGYLDVHGHIPLPPYIRREDTLL